MQNLLWFLFFNVGAPFSAPARLSVQQGAGGDKHRPYVVFFSLLVDLCQRKRLGFKCREWVFIPQKCKHFRGPPYPIPQGYSNIK